MWGLLLLLLAVLVALGVWGHGLAGPAGRAVDRVAGDAVGWARLLLPLLIGSMGWVLIRQVYPRRITLATGATATTKTTAAPPAAARALGPSGCRLPVGGRLAAGRGGSPG